MSLHPHLFHLLDHEDENIRACYGFCCRPWKRFGWAGTQIKEPRMNLKHKNEERRWKKSFFLITSSARASSSLTLVPPRPQSLQGQSSFLLPFPLRFIINVSKVINRTASSCMWLARLATLSIPFRYSNYMNYLRKIIVSLTTHEPNTHTHHPRTGLIIKLDNLPQRTNRQWNRRVKRFWGELSSATMLKCVILSRRFTTRYQPDCFIKVTWSVDNKSVRGRMSMNGAGRRAKKKLSSVFFPPIFLSSSERQAQMDSKILAQAEQQVYSSRGTSFTHSTF